MGEGGSTLACVSEEDMTVLSTPPSLASVASAARSFDAVRPGTASSARTERIAYDDNGSSSICTVTHEVLECAAKERAVVSM